MKQKLIATLMTLLLVIGLTPALAVDVGVGIGIDMETEEFAPLIWMDPDSRIVLDDGVEPGRNSTDGTRLGERENNYAFEGEQVVWEVLVMDKNGIEKISDVFVTIGPTQGIGNSIEANCDLDHVTTDVENVSRFNARILEERIVLGDADTMGVYDCILTVETPDSMVGEFFVTAEVEDLDGLSNIFDENEFWFFNPVIALSIDGTLDFGTVRPGSNSYTPTFLLGNDAELGSGVLLDMFISGTNFFDPSSSGAKCPVTNELALSNIRYFASKGAYSSSNDARETTDAQLEDYIAIPLGARITDADEILCTGTLRTEVAGCGYNEVATYSPGNVLSPGSEVALTFRLALPEPCNGDFSSGSIFFWGEAV